MNIDGFIFISECVFNIHWSKEEKEGKRGDIRTQSYRG